MLRLVLLTLFMIRLLSLVEESVMLFNYDKTCGCCAGILLLLSHGLGLGSHKLRGIGLKMLFFFVLRIATPNNMFSFRIRTFVAWDWVRTFESES